MNRWRSRSATSAGCGAPSQRIAPGATRCISANAAISSAAAITVDAIASHGRRVAPRRSIAESRPHPAARPSTDRCASGSPATDPPASYQLGHRCLPRAHHHGPQPRNIRSAARAHGEMRVCLAHSVRRERSVGRALHARSRRDARAPSWASILASARRARNSCVRDVPAAIPVIVAISSWEYPSMSCSTNTTRAPAGSFAVASAHVHRRVRIAARWPRAEREPLRDHRSFAATRASPISTSRAPRSPPTDAATSRASSSRESSAAAPTRARTRPAPALSPRLHLRTFACTARESHSRAHDRPARTRPRRRSARARRSHPRRAAVESPSSAAPRGDSIGSADPRAAALAVSAPTRPMSVESMSRANTARGIGRPSPASSGCARSRRSRCDRATRSPSSRTARSRRTHAPSLGHCFRTAKTPGLEVASSLSGIAAPRAAYEPFGRAADIGECWVRLRE